MRYAMYAVNGSAHTYYCIGLCARVHACASPHGCHGAPMMDGGGACDRACARVADACARVAEAYARTAVGRRIMRGAAAPAVVQANAATGDGVQLPHETSHLRLRGAGGLPCGAPRCNVMHPNALPGCGESEASGCTMESYQEHLRLRGTPEQPHASKTCCRDALARGVGLMLFAGSSLSANRPSAA